MNRSQGKNNFTRYKTKKNVIYLFIQNELYQTQPQILILIWCQTPTLHYSRWQGRKELNTTEKTHLEGLNFVADTILKTNIYFAKYPWQKRFMQQHWLMDTFE